MDVAQTGLDACTLNNALNVAQLIALVTIIRWLRTPVRDENSRK
jgi:hypothetical protein